MLAQNPCSSTRLPLLIRLQADAGFKFQNHKIEAFGVWHSSVFFSSRPRGPNEGKAIGANSGHRR